MKIAASTASVSLMLPLIAYAGIFSFLSQNKEPNAPQSTLRSRTSETVQNMVLLRAALNTDPNPAKGGGDITIVGNVALLAEAGPATGLASYVYEPSSDEISLYVVREGDTLSQIAGMFDVSVNTIMWANNIRSSTSIQPGDRLVILPVSGVRYTVEKGDTLQSIVKEYGGHMEEVLAFNGLSESATLSIGDVVIIPDGEVSTPVTQRHITRTAPPSTDIYAGYYRRPIDGGHRTQGIHGYNGVDIGAPAGTTIYAAASGTVIISRDYGWNGGYGHYIVIRHPNGTQTLYAHNSSNTVRVGQWVTQGSVVGYVGSTGRSTGPHVHFEVRGARNPF